MKTLNDYAKEVHEANNKWWIDLSKPCIHCLGTGDCNHCCRIVPDEPYCKNCSGLGYEPLQRNIGELLMLCVSELSEALEGHRKNLQDDKLPQYKMFDVEIVDCFIRMFDIFGGFNISIVCLTTGTLDTFAKGSLEQYGFVAPSNTAEALFKLCGAFALSIDSKGELDITFFRQTLYGLLSYSYQWKINLEEIYQAKMAYNKNRADHQIKNRMKEGGKKY